MSETNCKHFDSWGDGNSEWCDDCGKLLREWSETSGWVEMHEVHADGPIRGFVCNNCAQPIILTDENAPTIRALIRSHEKVCFS